MMFVVRTADQQWEGIAEDHFDACVQAIKSLKFNAIGVLMEARPVGTHEDDDEAVQYVSGARACRAAGMLCDGPPSDIHGG